MKYNPLPAIIKTEAVGLIILTGFIIYYGLQDNPARLEVPALKAKMDSTTKKYSTMPALAPLTRESEGNLVNLTTQPTQKDQGR